MQPATFKFLKGVFFMFRKLKKSLPFALIGVLAVTNVAMGSTVGVGSGNYTIASSTDKGSLSEGNAASGIASGINFTNLGTIDVGKDVFLSPGTAMDYVRVDDNTGKNAGWSALVSATPLTAVVPDSTASGNVTVVIPIENVLSAAASSPTPLFGAKAQAKVTSGTFSIGASAVNFFYAVKSQGAGAYTADLTYTMALPNYLPEGSTVTPDSASSSFKDADVTELGLFAGTYNTTITYSIGLAP